MAAGDCARFIDVGGSWPDELGGQVQTTVTSCNDCMSMRCLAQLYSIPDLIAVLY
jgi:hypothetical protein